MIRAISSVQRKDNVKEANVQRFIYRRKIFIVKNVIGRFYNFNSKTRNINKEHKRKRFHSQKCNKSFAKRKSLTQHDKSVHIHKGSQI